MENKAGLKRWMDILREWRNELKTKRFAPGLSEEQSKALEYEYYLVRICTDLVEANQFPIDTDEHIFHVLDIREGITRP